MLIDKIKEKATIAFRCIAIIYFFVAAYYFISLPPGGDELLFLDDLQLVKDVGWSAAIVKNISIPYILISYPFSLIMGNFAALKLVNILLFVLLLSYFYYSRMKSKSFYFYLLFFISTVGYFYIATNDSLFFAALIIFFNEVNNAVKKENINPNLALSALIIALFTRELIIVYMPVVFIGIYLIYKSGYIFTIKSFFPIGLFLMFIVLNVPSFVSNGNLSYDRKSPPEGMNVTWSQRQYLAQLMVNKGELDYGHHPSWEETVKYLEKNGKESLPDTTLKLITFDIVFTIQEFFKDFAYSLVYSCRSLGFIFVFSLLYWFQSAKKNLKLNFSNFIPFSTLIMVMIFSLITISFVELRWLMPVFIMTIVYYSDLEFQNKISKKLVLTNYIVVGIFSIYGIFRILNKI